MCARYVMPFLLWVCFGTSLDATSQPIRLGSFNFMRFGEGSVKDLERIAWMVHESQVDILSGLEILSPYAARSMLETLRHIDTPTWDVVLSHEKTGESSYKEYLAYFFKRNKVSLNPQGPHYCKDAHCFAKDSSHLFERDPYVAHFKSNHKNLTLVSVHVYYGQDSRAAESKRHVEIKALRRLMEDITYQEKNSHLIAMGDFNLEFSRDKYAHFPMDLLHQPPALLGLIYAPTTIGRSNFDHFLFFKESQTHYKPGSEQVIQDFDITDQAEKIHYKQTVSDHFPIAATFILE